MYNDQQKKYWLLCVLLLLSGLLCFILYFAYGSTLDQEGFVHEAFGFIPLGYALIFSGILGIVFMIIIKLYKNLKVK